MNRQQLQQKISRRSSKQKLRDDALLKQAAKNPALDAVLQPGSDGAVLSSTTFHAKVYGAARALHVVIPKLAALNAGVQAGSRVEVAIRRIS